MRHQEPLPVVGWRDRDRLASDLDAPRLAPAGGIPNGDLVVELEAEVERLSIRRKHWVQGRVPRAGFGGYCSSRQINFANPALRSRASHIQTLSVDRQPRRPGRQTEMPEDLGLRDIKRGDLPGGSAGDKKRSSILRRGDCRRSQPSGLGAGLFSRRLHGRRAAALPCRPETS